jgi:hypothetical protein
LVAKELRATLHALVERLDPEMFNHTVGKSNAIFGLAYGNIA